MHRNVSAVTRAEFNSDMRPLVCRPQLRINIRTLAKYKGTLLGELQLIIFNQSLKYYMTVLLRYIYANA